MDVTQCRRNIGESNGRCLCDTHEYALITCRLLETIEMMCDCWWTWRKPCWHSIFFFLSLSLSSFSLFFLLLSSRHSIWFAFQTRNFGRFFFVAICFCPSSRCFCLCFSLLSSFFCGLFSFVGASIQYAITIQFHRQLTINISMMTFCLLSLLD